MTKRQERMIEVLRRRAEDSFMYSEKYEFKKFEVDELTYSVSLVIEVGMKGDEGTLAQIFRDSVHVFIGPRGGVYYYNNNGTRKSLRGTSLLGVKLEQN